MCIMHYDLLCSPLIIISQHRQQYQCQQDIYIGHNCKMASTVKLQQVTIKGNLVSREDCNQHSPDSHGEGTTNDYTTTAAWT